MIHRTATFIIFVLSMAFAVSIPASGRGVLSPEVDKVVKSVKQLKRTVRRVPSSVANMRALSMAINDLEVILDRLDGPILPPPPPPPPRGGWFQTNGGNCAAVCAQKGLVSGPSLEGASCVSGETRAASAFGKIDFIHGCWPHCAPNFNSVAKSHGRSCYEPGQKKDSDRTDITVGCYCKGRFGRH